jgi:hypothetical protein
MADLTTLQTRLTQAESAYHKLLTGSMEERVDTGSGYAVAYTRADADKLLAYINTLKGEIAALGGGGRPRRGFIVNL